MLKKGGAIVTLRGEGGEGGGEGERRQVTKNKPRGCK